MHAATLEHSILDETSFACMLIEAYSNAVNADQTRTASSGLIKDLFRNRTTPASECRHEKHDEDRNGEMMAHIWGCQGN
jgi:hypothetical protein